MTRFLRHPVVVLVVGFVWLAVLYGVAQTAHFLVASRWPLLAVPVALAGAAAGLAGYAAFTRWWEARRPAPEIAAAPAARELAVGLLWGAGLFTLTLLLLLAVGAYRLALGAPDARLLVVLGVAILSGVMEELVFRAVFFRLAQALLGTWLALALSAALFGALHLSNPNSSPVAALSIALEAGVLLGLAYQATGRVWLPIGLHLAWNFTQGGIFGVPISGYDFGAGLFVAARQAGAPAWLSGGEFGAEASLMAVVVCLAGAVYFWRAARQAGRLVPAPWQRRMPPVASA
ncbi:MAG: CPBP family intramembrane metalloprotease [Anaerolineales bacterium]|nr:CPBP family intramembrane metalloprotease [Anaerolineales bacterium]